MTNQVDSSSLRVLSAIQPHLVWRFGRSAFVTLLMQKVYTIRRSLSFSFEHVSLILCIYGGRMGGSPAPLLSGYSHGARSDHIMRCGFLIIHTAHELSISKDFIVRLPGSALCCKSIIWAHNSH